MVSNLQDCWACLRHSRAPSVHLALIKCHVCLQVDLNDIESSTILSFRYIVEMGDGLNGLEKRQALKDWLDLLSRSHPLNR